jgi:hypothetical protein
MNLNLKKAALVVSMSTDMLGMPPLNVAADSRRNSWFNANCCFLGIRNSFICVKCIIGYFRSQFCRSTINLKQLLT